MSSPQVLTDCAITQKQSRQFSSSSSASSASSTTSTALFSETSSFTSDDDLEYEAKDDLDLLFTTNSTSETAFSHLMRISQSPLVRDQIGVPVELLASQCSVLGNKGWKVHLQVRSGKTVLEACGEHMGKKGARERAAQQLRFQLASHYQVNCAALSRPVVDSFFSSNTTKILEHSRQHLIRFQALAATTDLRDRVLVVDVETWDQEQRVRTRLLEVGTVHCRVRKMWLPGGDDESIHDHIMVQENMSFRNGDAEKGSRCPDNKLRYNEEFGESRQLTESSTAAALHALLDEMRGEGGRIFVIGHTVQGDIAWLQKTTGIDMSVFEEIDLAKVYQAYEGRVENRGLSWLCENYGIHGRNFHNGGNDASYTFLLAKRMMAMFLDREEIA